MHRLAALGCLLAVAVPSIAIASGDDSAKPESAPPATRPDAREAIRAARADLDAMVAALLQEEAGADKGGGRDIEVEVMPPALGSEASVPARPTTNAPKLEWLEGVALPDIPVRWHDLLLELLTYYRDDARGRGHMRGWLQRGGRYEAMIHAKLKEAGCRSISSSSPWSRAVRADGCVASRCGRHVATGRDHRARLRPREESLDR